NQLAPAQVELRIRDLARGEPRRVSNQHWPSSLLPLSQEPPDHRRGLLVFAFPDVAVADDPLAIHEERGWPRPYPPSSPDREIVVLHDGIADAEPLRRVDHLVVGLLPEELGTVHADDDEAVLAVPVIPA